MLWRVCCLALTAGLLCTATGCKSTSADEKAAASTAKPAPVTSAAPASSPDAAANSFYEVSGSADAVRTTRLSPKGQGILRTIKVREGDQVKTGQLLAVLDTTDVGIRAQAAAVAESQALAALKDTTSDYNRSRQLFDAGSLPDQTMDKAELAMRMADLQAQAAKVNVRMVHQALSDASLVAPFSGVITKVLAEEGQMITTMPPVVVFVLADVDTLEVRIPIPERRLAQVHVGTQVVVSFPAVNQEHPAKIDRIAEVVDPATRSTEAVIRLENKGHALPAGLYARVRFPTISADGDTPSSPPPAGSTVAGQQSGR